MIKKPWVEKYRPGGLNDVIFTDERTRRTFERYVTEGSIPHLLLYGPPGTGKTSVSKALCRGLNIDALDILRLNCSDEKIDALRDKVKAFATTASIGSGLKVVQLEEFDYLGHDAQALLRGLIEEVSGSCRFIGTCNYINKITPPLRSRFQEFHFSAPQKEEVAVRAAEILAHEGIEFDVETLDAVVTAGYPDMRKIIQLLEQHAGTGRLVFLGAQRVADWKQQLVPLLERGDFKAARQVVCNSATREELIDVYRLIYDGVTSIRSLRGKEDQAIVLVAQYMYQHAFVADPEINVAALFCELGAL